MILTDDFDLSKRNTLGLASRARHGGLITEPDQIAPVVAFARERDLPFHLLGEGSNCVLGERIDAVVAIMGLKGRSVDRDSFGRTRIKARAGEIWAELVEWSVAQGVGGLENLAGIPGTVGAAPVQNIGAYGRELDQLLESVTAYDTIEGAFRTLGAEECRFRYRHSRFKDEPGRYVIVETTLSPPSQWRPILDYRGLKALPGNASPAEVMRAVLSIRRSKLPDWRVLGNAGSFFHNPVAPASFRRAFPDAPAHDVEGGVKLSAGWLLEACGLKGHRRGGAGFYDKHALVLVNHGGATFRDVESLAALAIDRVRGRFGVELVQEPTVLT